MSTSLIDSPLAHLTSEQIEELGRELARSTTTSTETSANATAATSRA